MGGVLDGRTAVVTGAARGIGRAYAVALGRAGASVAIVDVLDGSEAVEELVGTGAQAAYYNCDVTDADATTRLAGDVVDRFGSLDILVNNAALYATLEPLHPFDIPVDVWRRVVDVNLTSLWLMARAAYPSMKAGQWGRIVNQSSIGAYSTPTFRSTATLAHYSTAKAGVLGLTRQLALALGRDGITVNSIAPGTIRTEALRNVKTDDELDAAMATQALKRAGAPSDLTGALVFLCSDEAAFMTGQTLVIDGGLVML